MQQHTTIQNLNKPFNSNGTTARAIEIITSTGDWKISIHTKSIENNTEVYRIIVKNDEVKDLQPLKLRWRISAKNIKGMWATNTLYEKRLRADWEETPVEARVSVDAPVICLFGHDDKNIQTFACADVINTVKMKAPVREENNLVYCEVELFTEKMPATDYYETEIRIDSKDIHFSKAINGVSDWWSSFEYLKVTEPPKAAQDPIYSTWYAYHQNFTTEQLLNECALSAKMGYKTIIVDDGWQTMDTNRGYDYTGDWQPDRIVEPADFVKNVQNLGMKCMFWYSVPFCGVKSKAYQRFKGKFLTENHRWAPVFDPRYPDVREYLINTYLTALKNWNLDGFKLDFIDDFKVYPETILTKENGRDYASVNAAVDRLMTDVITTLKAEKSDILIEFRQKYIGPAMRKYGNMFRAFDCPNDSATNRLRTTDVKMLCGNTIVHSDMFTWHYEEDVELAALQINNIFFSVPQLSVRINDVSDEHRAMIAFYTQYWLENQSLFLEGYFTPYQPLENYPLLKGELEGKTIFGVYENMVVPIENNTRELDLVNGKISTQIVCDFYEDLGERVVTIYDCQGNIFKFEKKNIQKGLMAFEVPASGIVQIKG